jgi:hypothetical protein
MKYPTIVLSRSSYGLYKKQTNCICTIANSIYQIFEGDKVYLTSDYTKDEINKFIESLTSAKAFSKDTKFL